MIFPFFGVDEHASRTVVNHEWDASVPCFHMLPSALRIAIAIGAALLAVRTPFPVNQPFVGSATDLHHRRACNGRTNLTNDFRLAYGDAPNRGGR